MTAGVAAPVVDTYDALSATDPPQDPQAGSYSSPRLSMAPPPMDGQSTQTAAPAATHMAAPLPLDMTRDPDVGATAITASATDTGMEYGYWHRPEPGHGRSSR